MSVSVSIIPQVMGPVTPRTDVLRTKAIYFAAIITFATAAETVWHRYRYPTVNRSTDFEETVNDFIAREHLDSDSAPAEANDGQGAAESGADVATERFRLNFDSDVSLNATNGGAAANNSGFDAGLYSGFGAGKGFTGRAAASVAAPSMITLAVKTRADLPAATLPTVAAPSKRFTALPVVALSEKKISAFPTVAALKIILTSTPDENLPAQMLSSAWQTNLALTPVKKFSALRVVVAPYPPKTTVSC
jgi:hypothetical protein